MGAAALQQAELDGTHLGVEPGLQQLSHPDGETAHLRVAEAVGGAGLRLGDEGAVGVVDALRNGDEHLVLLLPDGFHVGIELLQIKVHLGEVDQIRARAEVGGQRGGAGHQPALRPMSSMTVICALS